MNRPVSPFRLGRCAGVTLIELMVALGISMILMLAVYQVLTFAEGRKRTTTSVSDINQAGTYSAQVVDNWIRGAGSGFAPIASYAFGCKLNAKKNGTAVLPAASLPAPFANVKPTGTAGVFRLAPVLIVPDATTPNISGQPSDVLVIMAGTAGIGDLPANVAATPTSGGTSVTLDNTISYAANDIVLVTDQTVTGSAIHDCMVEQVTTPFTASTATTLPFSGTYAQGLGSFTASAMVSNIGNVVANNPPTFTLLGVGDNNTLYSYDLLQSSSTSSSIVADSVFEMHALYGVDTTGDGKIDGWYSPKVPTAATAIYGTTALMAGTSGAATLLGQIKAIRLGLIFRTSLQETSAADSAVQACTTTVAASSKQDGCVGPAKIELFKGLTDPSNNDISVTRSFTAAERIYRYRSADVVIPVRNNLML